MKFFVAISTFIGICIAAPGPAILQNRDLSVNIPEVRDANAKDQFVVKNLKSTHVPKGLNEISFEVQDMSTSPVASTTCSISWQRRHYPRGPRSCKDEWFTAQIQYYDDYQNFALNLNHAYGETCKGCNNQADEEYTGDVGSCRFAINEPKTTTGAKNAAGFEVAMVKSSVTCPIDFDN